jgi:hypothetical protein
MNNNIKKEKIPKPVLYTLLVLYLAGMAIILRKAYLGYQQRGENILDAQEFPYSRYSISNGKIYYLKAGLGYFQVDSADARTFRALNTVNDRGTMGKDARHVFFKTAPVPGLKPRDLLVYLGTNFYKTKIGVFYGSYHLKTADTASFHYIGDYYAADNLHLYYRQNVVPGADVRSLQAISFDSAKGNPPDEYIKDKNHVYFKGLRINGARQAVFTFLPAEDDVWDAKYAFDGQHYFNEEHEILVDHEEHKTHLRLLTLDKGFGWHGLFYQGTAIYCYDTDHHELVLMGHRDNSAPFTPINRGIFTDGKHVYFTFSIWNRSGGRMPRFVGHTTGLSVVEGADPRSFKATGNFVNADHVEGLLYKSGTHTYFHPNSKPLGNYSAGLMQLNVDGKTEQLPTENSFSKFIGDKDDGTSVFSLQFYKNLLKPDSVYDDY